MELNDIKTEKLEEHINLFKERLEADKEALAFNSFINDCFEEYLKTRKSKS